MKRILILGGGTAGTIVANKLYQELDPENWKITVVDKDDVHFYQPGFLFIPFGIYKGKRDAMRSRRRYMPRGVELILSEIEIIEPDKNQVIIKKDNRTLPYDFLIITTGSHTAPDETPGLTDHQWRKSIFDFYTIDGSLALSKKLRTWEGGRMVLNITEMPIKCPVAPLEFMFLADWYFHEHNMREKVELVMATPLDGAFTKPRASSILGNILKEKNIKLVAEFNTGEVDPDGKQLISYDERKVDYDLLITIPTIMGSELIARSGMGDELNYVPTEKHTLKAKNFDNVFVLGDATNQPSSKAGSVAHFEGEVFLENFLRYIDGLDLLPTFDGHANCYIESGFGKGFLIDFNYDVEPLPGMYPLPGIGPFSLLQESRMNHWGKMIFRWMYWNILLKGKPMPVTAELSMAGKWL